MAYTYYLYLIRLAKRHEGEPENYVHWFNQIQKVRQCCTNLK